MQTREIVQTPYMYQQNIKNRDNDAREARNNQGVGLVEILEQLQRTTIQDHFIALVKAVGRI
jgi:hypothetical protein